MPTSCRRHVDGCATVTFGVATPDSAIQFFTHPPTLFVFQPHKFRHCVEDLIPDNARLRLWGSVGFMMKIRDQNHLNLHLGIQNEYLGSTRWILF